MRAGHQEKYENHFPDPRLQRYGDDPAIADIGRIAREHGLVFCVDAAQTAGSLPIDIGAMDIDLLAFTGHKSLFGPQGTGGLYIREAGKDIFLP